VARLQARASRRRELARMQSAVTVDPRTHRVRLARVERVARGITLHLPRRLDSPNRWLWTHWSTKAAVKNAWALAIRLAVLDSTTVERHLAVQVSPAAAMGWIAPPARARVAIERLVPSARHFITDRDNRTFAGKGLVDCLVQAGFLRDDTEDAIDLVVDQRVSPDRLDWTVVAITVPEDVSC